MKTILTLVFLATIQYTFAQQNDAIVKKASEVETKWGYKAKNKKNRKKQVKSRGNKPAIKDAHHVSQRKKR